MAALVGDEDENNRLPLQLLLVVVVAHPQIELLLVEACR